MYFLQLINIRIQSKISIIIKKVCYIFQKKYVFKSDNKEIDKNVIVTNFTIPFNNKLTFKTDFYYERKLLPISIGEDSNRADISLGIQSIMMFQNDSFYKDTVYDKVSSIYIGPRASFHYHFFGRKLDTYASLSMGFFKNFAMKKNFISSDYYEKWWGISFPMISIGASYYFHKNIALNMEYLFIHPSLQVGASFRF